MIAMVSGPAARHAGPVHLGIARLFDGAIALAALLALVLSTAAALAPRLGADLAPAGVSSDGGHAYTVSPGLAVRWPYVVPSHPAFSIAPGDASVTEDGRPIGALQPDHAVIRDRGGGLYNLWEGSLWFSPSDDSDPRGNGRHYRLDVRAQLDPVLSSVRRWSLGLFAVLAGFRLATAVAVRVVPPLLRAAGAAAAPVHRSLARVPLTFRSSFCIVCALGLAGFAGEALTRPMPLAFEIDSFTYVQPGVLWDAGRDVAGQSTRDIGYPAVAALALALGSLARLPLIQLCLVLAGLACILATLYRVLRLIAARLAASTGFPVTAAAACACATAAVYLLLMFSHDLFVIDIYSAMAEAPHVLPDAAAFALFVAGWTARRAPSRLGCATGAVVAAYLSIMFKPHSAMVLALCGLSLAVVALREMRAFRSPAVLALCAASAAVVVAVHRTDVWVSPPGEDFGPKTIFCNHLDVVAPAFNAATPDRARIAAMMGKVLGTPNGWALMGFDGDLCVYNPAMTEAIRTVAAAEGMSTAAWQTQEVLRAVAARPGAYAADVFRQFAFYMLHPVTDADHRVQSVMPDDVWEHFAPFRDRIRMSRDQFLEEVGNWVPAAYPRPAAIAKRVLESIGSTFAAVTLGSTALALAALVALRGRADLRLEAAMVATAAFTLAFVMTTAVAHSFDVGRYLTDILPFSVIWWVMGLAYLAHALALCAAMAVRGDGGSLAAGETGVAEHAMRG